MTTKRRFIKHLPLMLAGLAMGLGVFVSVDGFRTSKSSEETTAYYTPSTHYEVSDTASELASYYSSISDSDNGTTLLSKLQSLNSTKRKRTVGYSTMGTSVSSSPYIYTDYVLNSSSTDSNGQRYGTSIASFYTKTSSTSFNKEHVWPNSHGGDNVEADILHTRPTISSENSSRGNSFYVEGMNNGTNGWDPYTAGYDIACRGECARIILYSVVAYSGFTLSDLNVHATTNANPDNMMGNMNTLIKWHFDYSPNQYEINRNNGAEYLQGNRNPFVDHPEYVARIWSSFNETVSNLCTNNASMYNNWTPGSYSSYGSNDAVDSTGVSISKTTASLVVGNTTTISATSSDSSTITWTTSNSSVASISSNSAPSGSSITVTAEAAGTATITAKATINSTIYIKTCSVTVKTSGGSGGGDSDYTLITSNSSLSNGDKVVIATKETTPNGVTGWNNSKDATISTSTSSWMQYTVGSASSSGFTLKDETANNYIASPGGNEFKYGSAGTVSVDSEGHCICNSRYLAINGTNYRFYTSIGSYTPFYIYKVTTSSSTPTLSSISVETAPSKTTYTAGEYFNPTGLVINRVYSDNSNDTYAYAGHSSEFAFTPSTSTALTVAHTSVTIEYGEKSCSQAITVNAPTPTSITASTNKTFKVGDIISSSDITVKDNNDNAVTNFTFSNDSYQFTYADAASGGASTSKTFTNAISYSNLSCSLTVSVSRAAYVAPSTTTDTITASDLSATGTSYSNFSNVSKISGAKYAGNSAKNNAGAIQIRSSGSNSGIVSTTSGGVISKVTITISSGTNTIDVYGKNSAYSTASDLYSTSTQGTLVGSTSSTGTITFSSSYTYVGIRSRSGAAYLTSVAIEYGSGESAKNIANYVMYTDTNGQCTTKLSTAVGYIKNLTSAEKTTFQTSNDYVISTARTRLNAWAIHEGKTINWSNGTLSNSNKVVPLGNAENNSTIITLLIISMISISSIGAYIYLNKKKSSII